MRPEHPPAQSTPRTFWNLSNHPIADSWGPDQRQAAQAWGREPPSPANLLRDLPFPPVNPTLGPEEVAALADATSAGLIQAGACPGETVMVMGEFTLVHALVLRLRKAGLVPVVATTCREARQTVQPDGSVLQQHAFRFVRFRPYP